MKEIPTIAKTKKELIESLIKICNDWDIRPEDMIYQYQRGELEWLKSKEKS